MNKLYKSKAVLTGTLAIAMLAGGLLSGAANAANHRESPASALDKIADITDWYTFPGSDNTTVIAGNYDGLSLPSNGPNFFPFHDEIAYTFRVDNNQDSFAEDLLIEFRFTRLDDFTDNVQYRIPENFTAFAGIGPDACFGIVTSVAGIPTVVCTPTTLPFGGQGRTAPVNAPMPIANFRDGFVISPQIASLSSSGLGAPQRFSVRVLRDLDNNRFTPLTQVCFTNNLNVLPTNVGRRTFANYVQLFDTSTSQTACGMRIFAGTTDDAFPVNLGGAFDTINLPLLCGGGANLPTVEVTQGELGNCTHNQVDGMVVNTIVVQAPDFFFTQGRGNGIIGTYGVNTRPRLKQFAVNAHENPFFDLDGIPGGAVTRDSNATAIARSNIARMGNPLFNEVIVGTGCKNRSSQGISINDGILNNCIFDVDGAGLEPVRRHGGLNYPDITTFVIDPVLPRIVNALVQVCLPALPLVPIGGCSGVVPAADANDPIPVALLNTAAAINAREGGGSISQLVFFTYRGWAKELCEAGLPALCFGRATGNVGADLLRLDTTTPFTSPLLRRRMGPMDNTNLNLLPLLCNDGGVSGNPLLVLDPAGWPNGRRISDDVIDQVVRAQMGTFDCGFLNELPTPQDPTPHVAVSFIGDGTQGNDLGYLTNLALGTGLTGYREIFPYFAPAQDGVLHRQIDVGEGPADRTMPGGGLFPVGSCPLSPVALCPGNPNVP